MCESMLLLRLLPLCSAVVFGLMRLKARAKSKAESLPGVWLTVKYLFIVCAIAPLVFAQASPPARASKTLVGIWAHADDDAPVAPLLARYAREGAQVYTIIATDGSQGCKNTTIPCGPELARVRSEEARCSCEARELRPPMDVWFYSQIETAAERPTHALNAEKNLHRAPPERFRIGFGLLTQT